MRLANVRCKPGSRATTRAEPQCRGEQQGRVILDPESKFVTGLCSCLRSYSCFLCRLFCLFTSYRFSVPTYRLLIQVDMHLLGLEIFFDTARPKFASEAGLFVSTPWSFDVCGLHMIHPHDPRSQRFHHAEGFENVACPYRGCEPVRRIIGDFKSIFFVFEWNDGSDRAEDFFARNAGAVVDVVENCRFDVVSLG